MIKALSEPIVVVARLVQLFGSLEAVVAVMTDQVREIETVWNQDQITLGRILKAHLFVEHFLTMYIKAKNPNLADVQAARLTFAQKISLAHQPTDPVSYIFPGIRRLNKIRNRISHTLSASVTNEDGDTFLAIGLFREFRKAVVKPLVPSEDPIVVLEDFAKHAGLILQSASNPDTRIQQAMRGD